MLSISGRVGIQCKQRQQKKRIILSPLDIIPDAETNEKPRLRGNIWGKYHLQSKPYSDKKKKKDTKGAGIFQVQWNSIIRNEKWWRVKCISGNVLILGIQAVICWPLSSHKAHISFEKNPSPAQTCLTIKAQDWNNIINSEPKADLNPVCEESATFSWSLSPSHTHTHTHTNTEGGSSLWVCKQLWIIVFTDGICATCGFNDTSQPLEERQKTAVTFKVNVCLSLPPSLSFSPSFFYSSARFNFFTSLSLIGISVNEAFRAKAEQ